MAFIQLRSAPAEKLGPCAASTTTRTRRSCPTPSSAAVSSAISASLKALCTSVRVRVMRATPCLSISWTKRGKAMLLHPENAEAGGLGGRVERRRDAEAEGHAGVARINDAIVPQPRSRVIGMALRLILVADRRLEALLLRRRPVLALGRPSVTAKRSEEPPSEP